MSAEAQAPTKASTGVTERFDAVVVGAGFAGMYMLHRLRELGMHAIVFEAGGGVGGTWYWNRYPGARCDVESMQYSYQFSEALQREWDWSERYATQPEILRYANHVADRFDLRRDIRFDTRVVSAVFDDGRRCWRVTTDDGRVVESVFCIMATGCLSAPHNPRLPGLDSFRGDVYHTGEWPHQGVDFTGLRVGVIGTGSSAIQAIPVIAQQAQHLYVFQRTAHYTVPARNAPLDPVARSAVKADYRGLRERARQMFAGIDLSYNPQSALDVSEAERERAYEQRWERGGVAFMGAYADLLLSPEANATAAAFVRRKIREIVRDPAVADALCPDYVIGCKRLCVDTGYYDIYNRPEVTLVDVRNGGIDGIAPEGVRAKGELYPLDALVLATGFDAMTGALLRIDIRGRGAQSLRTKWRDGPRTYLGLMTAGFPNLFMVTGPGSPSVLTNMLPSIEQHVEWIADCLAHLRERRLSCIEPSADAEDRWMAHVGEVAASNLRSSCNSWYVGANVAGKARVFMPYIGGFPAYLEKCREVVAGGYDGFALSAPHSMPA